MDTSFIAPAVAFLFIAAVVITALGWWSLVLVVVCIAGLAGVVWSFALRSPLLFLVSFTAAGAAAAVVL